MLLFFVRAAGSFNYKNITFLQTFTSTLSIGCVSICGSGKTGRPNKEKMKENKTMNTNTNTKELNLNEMEMINGGDKTTDNMLSKGGALVGTAVGFTFGVVVGFFED